MKKLFFLILFIGLFLTPARAEIVVENFQEPDIRNDFCGAMIDFRYCKCGFHNVEEYCEQIGHTDSSANEVVQNKFSDYVVQEKDRFATNCENNNAILSGDTCTYCVGEHFRYKDNCVTNEEMCGTEDPYLEFSVHNEKCYCIANYELGDDGLCKEKDIVEVNFEWLDDNEPPFLADGTIFGTADVSVKALKMTDQPLIPVDIVLTTSSQGVLTVEDMDENQYQITYTTPDLRNADTTKNYYAGINLNFTAKDETGEMVEKDKVVKIPLVIATPVKISAYGFETLEDKVVFKGGDATVEVNIITDEDEDEYFPIIGAKIELPQEKIFTTDSEGEVEIPTPNDFIKGETDDVEFNLTLNEEVSKQLSQVRSKLSGLRGNVTIQSFLDDFVEDLATADDNEERKNMVDGLKRINYALFFVEKGKEFGKVSSNSLAMVTKDAVANMVDLLDSVLGITGKITDKINSKGAKLGDKAVEKISKQVDEIYKASLQKLGAAMQAGVNKYAPKSKIYIGGLLRFLEDKYLISDNLKKKAASKLDLYSGIKEYFGDQVNDAAQDQMQEIAAFVASGRENGFPTLEYSADLDIAKNNYATMADKYLKAEEGEYWRAMTKSWFDLGFDTIVKGISIVFPIYATVVSQVENMYKVARSGFVDAANMFQWYKAHEDIMTQIDRGLKHSLGQEVDYQTLKVDKSYFQIFPVAYAEDLNEGSDNSEFMDAVADAQIYKSFAEIGVILAEEFPDEEEEFKAEIDKLNKQSKDAVKKAKELKEEVGSSIPESDASFWEIPTAKEMSISDNQNVSIDNNMMMILIAGGILIIVLGGFVYLVRRKK